MADVTCTQKTRAGTICGEAAWASARWPGGEMMTLCANHAKSAVGIAQAMGFALHIEPFGVDPDVVAEVEALCEPPAKGSSFAYGARARRQRRASVYFCVEQAVEILKLTFQADPGRSFMGRASKSLAGELLEVTQQLLDGVTTLLEKTDDAD